MRMTSALLRSGLLGAWLALIGVLAGPAMAPSRVLAMAATLDAAPICADHDGAASDGPATADHHLMAECGLCPCCAPLLAIAAPPPPLPMPARVHLAARIDTAPATAPPGTARTTSYARGPPVSI